MMEEKIAERQNDTGHESRGETGHADSEALQSRGTGLRHDGLTLPGADGGDLGQASAPCDPITVAADQVLAQAPELCKSVLNEFDEQLAAAMGMHRHYKEIAVNGTDADIGPMNADEMSLRCLEHATTVSRGKASILSEMMRGLSRRGQGKQPVAGAVAQGGRVTQQNNTMISHGMPRREQLAVIDRMGSDNDGKKGIPTADELMRTIMPQGGSVSVDREEEPDDEFAQ
jgi:hypothetical protein